MQDSLQECDTFDIAHIVGAKRFSTTSENFVDVVAGRHFRMEDLSGRFLSRMIVLTS